jgi:hypothetical protein
MTIAIALRLTSNVAQSVKAIAFASFLIAIVGCGRGLPETAPVHGRVTVDGQPVSEGMMTFHPPAGRPATGVIKPDGTFELSTFEPADGALLGSHRVTIDATKTIAATAGAKSWEEELAMGGIPSTDEKTVWLVPAEFAELQTTNLTAEVRAGENEINFDVPAVVREH